MPPGHAGFNVRTVFLICIVKKLRHFRNLKEIFRILDYVSSDWLNVSTSQIELLAVQKALLANLVGHFIGNSISNCLRQVQLQEYIGVLDVSLEDVEGKLDGV